MKVIPTNFAASYAATSCGGSSAALLLAVVGQDLRRLYGESPAALPEEMEALVARLAEASALPEPTGA
jgi:hypothetical protein